MRYNIGDRVVHVNDPEDMGRISDVCRMCEDLEQFEQCLYPYFVVWEIGDADWFAESDLELPGLPSISNDLD